MARLPAPAGQNTLRRDDSWQVVRAGPTSLEHVLAGVGGRAMCFVDPEAVRVACGGPVAGSRLNATQVTEPAPRLAETIAITVTAVPRSAGIRSWRRYTRARSEFHDSNTARTASCSCSCGACGKSRPVCSAKIFLYTS